MSLDISDGSNFYTLANHPSGTLLITYKTSLTGTASNALEIGKSGTIISQAYTNQADPTNLDYEVLVADASGTISRKQGLYNLLTQTLQTSENQLRIDLSTITQDVQTLTQQVNSLNLSSLSTTIQTQTTQIASLSNDVSFLKSVAYGLGAWTIILLIALIVLAVVTGRALRKRPFEISVVPPVPKAFPAVIPSTPSDSFSQSESLVSDLLKKLNKV